MLFVSWPRFAAAVRKEGAGALAFVTGATILALLPESRQSIFAVPWFVAFLAVSLDRVRFERWAVPAFGATALVLSRVWFRIGAGTSDDLAQLRVYFMPHGPYMQTRDYWWQAAAVLILVAVARATYLSAIRSGGTSAPGDVLERPTASRESASQ